MVRKYLINTIMLLFIIFLAACGDQANKDGQENGVIKIANYFAEDHPQNIALKEKFIPQIEEKTEFEVELYSNSELGDEEEFTNSVRNGNIEMAVTGMIMQTSKPKLGAIEWPFLFENYDQAKKVLDGEVGNELGKEYEDLGATPLAWTANGFRVISSNKEISSMSDFEGIRLRMPDASTFVKTGKALGANVQGMGISEVFTALEQDVIDAQENPYATLKESAYYEVQDFVLESNHMFSPNIYIMNQGFFEGLDKETQQIFLDAANEAADYEWELLEESDEDIKSFLEEKGLKITEPDQKFKDEMEKSVEPVYEDIFQEYDWAKELYNKIQKEIGE